MALSREAYRALEDIVGPENISKEPAILDSYAFQWLAETVRPGQSKFMPRPEAAVLPGNTEEVQAIVKTCNRYKIKVKPYSTGWYFYCAPQTEGVIQLDMRRMDRILEIDERNMFAVVEPYVIAATLQAEVMKLGLNCCVTGAGASCSPLASATSYHGAGPSSIFGGENNQNLLSLEWVMPNGDILRTGSLGSGLGWFCGEGPGPSLRGIVRGTLGAKGGLGVFTKCALKLFPWPGPAELPVEGTVPAYNSPLPDNFRAYSLAFPSWENYFEAYYKIYDNEIGYIAHRQFSMLGTELGTAFWMLYNDPTKTLDDIEEFTQKPEIKKLTEEMKIAFQIVLAGLTPRHLEYQEKVLDEILADTGGWKVAAMSQPAMERFTLLYLIRLGHKNLNFVYNGGWLGTFMQAGPPDYVKGYRHIAQEVTEPYQKKGLLVDCGADAMMGPVGSMGGGGNCALEQFGYYDVADEESTDAVVSWTKDCVKGAIDKGFVPGKGSHYLAMGMTREQRQSSYASAPWPGMYRWQRKIKGIIDPNDIGDELYPTMDEPGK